MRRATLRDRAEFALVRALEAGIGRLSDRSARRVGEWVGELLRFPAGVRREVVAANLARAFPDADPAWREEVARQSYRHLGREAVEMVRLSRLTPEQVVQRTEIPPGIWAEFREALEPGRGALLVTGHYGNWELAAAAISARGIPIEAIAKRQRNPLVDAQIAEARRRLGIRVMDMSEASKRVLRALSEGHVIGIVADQDARRAGVWVPFFGVPSSTYRGPAMFALRFGVPLFSAVARRLPDGRYRVDGARIPAEPTGDLEADVRRVTAAVAAHLEGEIRQEPGQYFWFHKRWKSQPPTEPSGEAAGTTHPLRQDPIPPAADPSETDPVESP